MRHFLPLKNLKWQTGNPEWNPLLCILTQYYQHPSLRQLIISLHAICNSFVRTMLAIKADFIVLSTLCNLWKVEKPQLHTSTAHLFTFAAMIHDALSPSILQVIKMSSPNTASASDNCKEPGRTKSAGVSFSLSLATSRK